MPKQTSVLANGLSIIAVFSSCMFLFRIWQKRFVLSGLAINVEVKKSE